MNSPAFRQAATRDIDLLLQMMKDFYAIDHYPFDAALSRQNVVIFIEQGTYGKLWVVELNGTPIGYAALTLAFSFEYGGITAFLDELYLVPEQRNKGFGRKILEFLVDEARNLGIQSIHMEVEKHNTPARKLYRQWGFTDKDRLLLTRKIAE